MTQRLPDVADRRSNVHIRSPLLASHRLKMLYRFAGMRASFRLVDGFQILERDTGEPVKEYGELKNLHGDRLVILQRVYRFTEALSVNAFWHREGPACWRSPCAGLRTHIAR